jgi:ABC-type lipoprotein export system ATPase subunit
MPSWPKVDPEAPALDLRGVWRTYESAGTKVHAISELTLRVERGESVAVTGPSGSGKSTLLGLIAGLDRPTGGEVRVLGIPLNDKKEQELTAFRAANLGLVFQDPHLLPGLSALENVIAARIPWSRRRVLEPEARKLLDAVGLGQRTDFPPARLSGGERQRVGIARALLGQPSMLLADEPSGNLDIATTEELLAVLEELRIEMGLTLVIATHDPTVAAITGRVIRLVGGKLAEDRSIPLTGQADIHRLEA